MTVHSIFVWAQSTVFLLQFTLGDFVVSLAMCCLIAIAWKTMGSLSDITGFMELSKTEVNMSKMYCCNVIQCLL